MIQSIIDFSMLMVEYFTSLYDQIKFVWEFTIGDFVPVGLRPLTDPVLESRGIADFSLLAFIFGAGVTIYLGYQIVTWLLNIVT